MQIKKRIEKALPLLRKGKILFFPLLFCYSEIALHLFAYRSLSWNTGWILLFALGLGFFFSFLTNAFPQKVNLVLTYVLGFFVTLVYEIQMVYFEIFKGFAPLSSAKMGGQAVTNFAGQTLEGIHSAFWMILVLLLPFICLCALGIWQRAKFSRPQKWYSFLPLGISAGIFTLTLGVMALFFSGSPSLFAIFNSSSTSTDVSVSNFGLGITMVQETRWLILPEREKLFNETLSDATYGENDQVDPAIDMTTLFANADSKKMKSLTAALSNMPISQKNPYTGLCEGYNLIALCAEAFSPEFIDPTLTPTLYKLVNSGFIFENFYSGFPNTTTNGEYAFCMGLLPDVSRGKTDSSFGLSATHYLPYCYGNLFKNQGGVAKAYHNYVAEFYHRNYTHTNMGYDFKAGNSGLDIEVTWPSSDHDMMMASVDEYINSGKQFVAYYMTFSGHYQYTMENAMSAKNWEKVKHLNYSNAVKAYIACNLEVEMALSYLMERLEEAGIADKTAIVLTTDHYPYGLTDEEYAELSGREINNIFDKQKNSFICYVPNMEPVRVSNYCSTIDILPTVLNLFGFTYDSRLLAGQDVLAENVDHVAVLADGSFIAEGFRYDSSQAYFQYDEKTDEVKERAARLYEAVDKKFRISTEILNNDYYAFAYGRETSDEVIQDPTTQYLDVGIMNQAPVYYVLTNELMEPKNKNNFGLYDECTIAEMLNAIYRMAGSPEAKGENPPFTAPRDYRDARYWCYEVGILTNDGLFPTDLDQGISVGQACLILARAADYFGIDTTPNESAVKAMHDLYTDLPEPVIRATVFCRDQNLVVGDGNYAYAFYASQYAVDRSFAAGAIYKFGTYLLTDKEA